MDKGNSTRIGKGNGMRGMIKVEKEERVYEREGLLTGELRLGSQSLKFMKW